MEIHPTNSIAELLVAMYGPAPKPRRIKHWSEGPHQVGDLVRGSMGGVHELIGITRFGTAEWGPELENI